jgi:hypothetical protein
VNLGLAAPLWLLGLLGLLAPLVLHLLARGRGRRVRVGSVRLLTESPPRRPRRLQLQRPLLLALRCLLLALVALALAEPRLRREAAAPKAPRAWVLVEPGVRVEGVEAARRAVAAGAEERLLTAGLPRARAFADQTALPDLAAVPGGLWSLLREAAAAAPAGTRLVVVTSGRLGTLRGERPALANAVEWYEAPDHRANRWIARATASGEGAAPLVGASDRSRTTFSPRPAPGSDAAPKTSGAGPRSGGDVLPGDDGVAGDDRAPAAAPRSLSVAVLAAADRQADARYVRTALAVAAEAAGVRIEVSTAARPVPASPPAALTFWLADAPPPPPLLDGLHAGAVLVTDSGAPEESCRGTFVVAVAATPVALYRCGASGGANATRTASSRTPAHSANGTAPTTGSAPAPQRPSWVADSGRAVLMEQAVGNGRWLRFASRFHPAWSELVLSPAFPEWLRDLVRTSAGADATAELAASDRRADGGQGRPAAAARVRHETATSSRSSTPPSPLPERAAWLLLFPLLLAERWLATRR